MAEHWPSMCEALPWVRSPAQEKTILSGCLLGPSRLPQAGTGDPAFKGTCLPAPPFPTDFCRGRKRGLCVHGEGIPCQVPQQLRRKWVVCGYSDTLLLCPPGLSPPRAQALVSSRQQRWHLLPVALVFSAIQG